MSSFFELNLARLGVPVFALFMLVSAGACTAEAPTAARADQSESAQAQAQPQEGKAQGSAADAVEELTVYASPGCGCCAAWATHLEEQGVTAEIERVADMSSVKHKLGVAPEHRSCHTAVSEEGYVFEGHIPVRYIRQFLADPPEGAIGLSVPGMPLGSPGMEMNGQFTPYEVLVLRKDGTAEVFARVDTPADQ